MIKKALLLVLVVLSFTAGIFVLAFLIFLFPPLHELRGFSSIMMSCSIGAAVIGGFMISSSVGACPPQVVYMHLIPAHSQHNEDLSRSGDNQQRTPSWGILVFVSAVIAGMIGYMFNSLV